MEGSRKTVRLASAAEHADLIAQDRRIDPVHRLRVAALEAQIALGADHEEAACLVQRVQPIEVRVAPVEQVEGLRFGREQVQHIDLVGLAVADVNEARDRAAHVQQGVQLDRGLGRAERRPRIDRQTQVDRRGVEGVDRLLQVQADRLAGVQRSGNADQVLRQIGIDLPRPNSVGIGQRVARHRRAKSQVVEPVSLRRKTDLDVAQRLAKRQLREGHGIELVQAGEALDLVLAVVARHAATKRGQRQVHHDLREYELALMHRHPRRDDPARGTKSAARSSNRDQTRMTIYLGRSSTYQRLACERWDTTGRK